MSKQAIPEEISLNTVVEDVWDFIKRPRLDHISGYFKVHPFRLFPYLLLLDFMLMIPLSSLIGIVGLEEMDHKIVNLYDQPMLLAMQAILLAPIVEEAVFRLPMKYSYVRMFVPCCIALGMLSVFIDSTTTLGFIAILFFLLVALFHYVDQRNDNQYNERMATLWEANFYIPFWILTVSFALLHLTNFGGQVAWYVAPILVLPQFVLGALLGYIRTGLGFVFAVLFHALHNGIFLGLALIAQSALPST